MIRHLVGALAVLALCAPIHLHAQPTKAPEQRFGLSISGGVSLGAYEAGVNWALLEALRAEPGAKLDVVTGASAGNINAFLVAREWCASDATRQTVSAQDNWFWRAWVDIGLFQLLPESRRCAEYHRDLGPVLDGEVCESRDPYWPDDGLLSRKGMEPILKSFTDAMGKAEHRPGCELPLGVTTTRSEPSVLKLAGAVDVKTQRYVVPLMACVVDGKLVFRNYQSGGCSAVPRGLGGAPTYEELGKAMFLPHDAAGIIAMDDVADVIKASSAFPAAFGTVELDYCEVPTTREASTAVAEPQMQQRLPTDFRADEPLCAPRAASRAAFLDGGVFDNVPLALGVYMDADQHRGEPAEFVYIDPDTRRGPATKFGGSSSIHRRGFGQLAQFAGNFVGVARQYELQTLARQKELVDHLDLRTTSRMPNIYGEHIVNFSALIARPFREADFHMGVYDGLHYWASRACEATGCDVVTTLLALLDQLVPANPANLETRWVVAKLACHEANGLDSTACDTKPPTGARIVAALVDGQIAWLREQQRLHDAVTAAAAAVPGDPVTVCARKVDRARRDACRTWRDAAQQLSKFESRYLAGLTAHLVDDRDLTKLMRDRHDAWEHAKLAELEVYPRSQLTHEIRFIERWDASLRELMLTMAQRSRTIDNEERNSTGEVISEGAEFGLLTWREHASPRWRWFPSTVPFYADDPAIQVVAKSIWRVIWPHTISLDVADGAFARTYEWRVLQSPFSRHGFSIGFTFGARYKGRDPNFALLGTQNAILGGVALDWAIAPVLMAELLLSGGAESETFVDPVDGDRFKAVPKKGLSSELRLALVDKVVLGGGVDVTARNGELETDVLATVGIRDLGGLLYWMARFAFSTFTDR